MQRYFGLEREEDKFILCDDDLYHIKTVMRMKDGDKIEVVYENDVWKCLVSVKKKIEIFALKKLEKYEKTTPFVHLVIPLLKENKLNLILQKATEMGVDEMTIISMERCVVKMEGNKIEKKLDRWMRIVKEAAEQSKRVDIPKIIYLDNLKKVTKENGLNLVCSTLERKKNLKRVLTKSKNCDRINLVMGPEGGLSKDEENYLVSIGFDAVTLGNQILRVETVPLFLMSVIDYEYME